jgi:hypothetical protein
MNRQEMFDKVATELLKQGKPALDSNSKCSYLNVDGHRCAAGWLLPDDPKILEVARTSRLGYLEFLNELKENACNVPAYLTDESNFIANLQCVHDGAVIPTEVVQDHWLENWKSGMRLLARKKDLSSKVLEKSDAV